MKKLALALVIGIVVACIPKPTSSPIAYNGPRDRWYLEPAPPARVATGIASWYDARSWYTYKTKWFAGTRNYGAAGRELRLMIRALYKGHHYYHQKPIRAEVSNPKTGVSVMIWITDVCGCTSGTPNDRSDDKLIDLSPEVFRALGIPLSRGIQKVVITLLP